MLVQILPFTSQAVAVEPTPPKGSRTDIPCFVKKFTRWPMSWKEYGACLLYTSDAADEL